MQGKTTVHVVPSFHYDVAYRKTFSGYLDQSLGNIRAALKLLRDHPGYTHSIEQVILVREYWKRYPRDRAALRRFAREGRLIFAPGMFTMPDSNIPSGENFIRNALIGRAWLKENLGTVPDCCWMADIFGHNPQSPQLARTCGFSSYMFERGKAGSWDTPFLWRGIDGTELPTQWEVDTYYGINIALAWMGDRPLAWVRRRLRDEVLGPLQANGAAPDLLLTPLGGDFLQPTEAHIDSIRALNRAERDARFVFSTPARYFDAIAQRGAQLPVASDDLNPLMEGTCTSRIRIKQCNRRLEELAAALEMAEAMSTKPPHGDSEALWETLAWNAFHDIIAGTLIKQAAREALRKYETAERKATRALERRIASLAGSRSGKGQGQRTVWFNSLPYARAEIVRAAATGTASFARITVPACGLATVPRRARGTARGGVRVRSGGRILENRLLRLRFGQNGTIASLMDKQSGYELAVPESGMNNPVLQTDGGDLWTLHDRPVNGSLLRTAPYRNPQPRSGSSLEREGRVGRKAADADCFAWPTPKVIDDHPLQATVEIAYPVLGFTTRVSLRDGEKLVRFRTSFMPRGKRYHLRVAFPTAVRGGHIRHSVPFGHIERPEGEYAVQGWIDYADSSKGLLLLNRGLPGNNVTDGVMLLSLFRAVSLEDAETTPWFEEGIEQVFEYAVMPFRPRDKGYNPARRAALFNRPLHAVEVAVARSGTRSTSPPLAELEGDGAEVSCVRWEDGELVVRVWESRGRRSKAALLLGIPVAGCVETDATGENRRPCRCRGNRVPLALRPFEVRTLRLSF